MLICGRRWQPAHTEAVHPAYGPPLAVAAIIAVTLSACTPSGRTTATASPHPDAQTAAYAPTTNDSPTGKATPSSYRGELSRPLHFPVLRPGQACPTSGGKAINTTDFSGVAQGAGPVHPSVGQA